MSLAQHVSSSEGPDRDPDTYSTYAPSVVPSILSTTSYGRRLSYHPGYPVETLPFHEKTENIGAYEVSPTRRIVQVTIGIIACVFASGIVFGFAALKSILIDEGIYREHCTAEEVAENIRLCFGQDLRLNLTFIIASITTNVSALPVGTLLDRYGPRLSSMIGCIFLIIGSLLMALAKELYPFDAFVVGSFCLALGGTSIFIPTFHLSNAFPRFQGLILALVTGAFDASAAVFLFFRVTYDASDGRFGLRQFFLIYTIIPIAIFIAQLTVMPRTIYQTIGELGTKAQEFNDAATDVHDSDDDLEDADIRRVRSGRAAVRERRLSDVTKVLGTYQEQKERAQKESDIRVNSGVWGALHGMSAWNQMRTPWFLLITILTIITMARFNFFIATIWSQYRYYFNDVERATQINDFFDLALPIGGIISVPFIGFLLDHSSMATVLATLVLISTTFGALGVLPTTWAAYGNVILFVLFRPLYYSAMSDYAAKVFGFATFGSVYGAIICISGLCTFIQFPLQTLTHEIFDDNPTVVNLVLTNLGAVVGSGLAVYLLLKTPGVRKEIDGEDRDPARQRLLSTLEETEEIE